MQNANEHNLNIILMIYKYKRRDINRTISNVDIKLICIYDRNGGMKSNLFAISLLWRFQMLFIVIKFAL